MFNQRRTGENRAIQRRREVEDNRNTLQKVIHKDWVQQHKAEWELRTAAQIEKNQITDIARTLKAQDDKYLQGRRERLRDLLAADDEVHRQELAAKHETSAEKAKRMVEYARKLKQDREARRLAFVQEQYARRWRDSCDDLRTIDSEHHTKHCMDEVGLQMQERALARAKGAQEEKMWAEIQRQDQLAKSEREEAEARNRKAFNFETKQALLTQMQDGQSRREQEAKRQAEERAAFQAQMEADAEAARQQARDKQAEKRELQQRVAAFNEDLREQRQAELARRRAEERADLEQKLEEHRVENQRKANDKAEMQRDMASYRAYLQRRREEEAAMERELERLTQEELQRANSKRDMVWMREDLARKQLLKEVYEGRMEQIKEKELEHMRRNQELEQERAAIKVEIERARQLQEEEDANERRREEARRADLEKQMQNNRSLRKIEESKIVSEREAAIEADKRYRAFLEREQREQRAGTFVKKNYGKRSMDVIQ